MKRIKYLLGSLICIVLLMSIVSCSTTVKSELHPHNYQRLSQLIGGNKKKVCQELEIQEDEMQLLATGLYQTPMRIEFLGFSFEVLLNFDVENDKLYAFSYRKVYSNQIDVAEVDMKNMFQQLTDLHGKPDTYEGIVNRVSNIESFAKGEAFSVYDVWNVSDEEKLYFHVSTDGESNVDLQLQYRFEIQ